VAAQFLAVDLLAVDGRAGDGFDPEPGPWCSSGWRRGSAGGGLRRGRAGGRVLGHGQFHGEGGAARGGDAEQEGAGGVVRVQRRQLQQAVGVRLQAGEGAHRLVVGVLEEGSLVVLGGLVAGGDEGGGGGDPVGDGPAEGGLHLHALLERAAGRAGQLLLADADEAVGGAFGDGGSVVEGRDRAADDRGPDGEG